MYTNGADPVNARYRRSPTTSRQPVANLFSVKELTSADIRHSFVNAAPDAASRVPMPGLHDVMWADREYLGWRDRQSHSRGYLVFWRGETPTGIVLRASEFSLENGISAMCSLCRITQPSAQIALFSAPRAGQAGIDGNTIGTYICADLACSHLVRVLPPASAMIDPERLLSQRITGLLARVDSFAADVLKSA